MPAFLFTAIGVGVLGLAAPSHARREHPLSLKLSHTVEYCYLARVSNPDPQHLGYEVKQVLRRQSKDKPLLRIELFGATPKGGALYVVWATNKASSPARAGSPSKAGES